MLGKSVDMAEPLIALQGASPLIRNSDYYPILSELKIILAMACLEWKVNFEMCK